MSETHVIEPTRPCDPCKGTGRASYDASRPCTWCGGMGYFEAPDFQAIVEAVRGRKHLRSRPPKDPRAYYVWRLARFYGGKDVCLPIVAHLRAGRDAYQKELDALAALLAEHFYGTSLAGPHRWARALGWLDKDTPRLPGTAYQGGPVLGPGVVKPVEEEEELR